MSSYVPSPSTSPTLVSLARYVYGCPSFVYASAGLSSGTDEVVGASAPRTASVSVTSTSPRTFVTKYCDASRAVGVEQVRRVGDRLFGDARAVAVDVEGEGVRIGAEHAPRHQHAVIGLHRRRSAVEVLRLPLQHGGRGGRERVGCRAGSAGVDRHDRVEVLDRGQHARVGEAVRLGDADELAALALDLRAEHEVRERAHRRRPRELELALVDALERDAGRARRGPRHPDRRARRRPSSTAPTRGRSGRPRSRSSRSRDPRGRSCR